MLCAWENMKRIQKLIYLVIYLYFGRTVREGITNEIQM
jgi:hypothetical protein